MPVRCDGVYVKLEGWSTSLPIPRNSVKKRALKKVSLPQTLVPKMILSLEGVGFASSDDVSSSDKGVCGRMFSVKDNPFRVLNLFANSSERESLREVRRLQTYLDVGRTIDCPNSIDTLGPVMRSKELVEAAASAIEQPKDRILHSMFWFVNASPKDEEAFKLLRNGDLDGARMLWYDDTQGEFADEDNFSSFANLSTLLLWDACEQSAFDLMAFQESMDVRGRLLSSPAFEDFAEIVGLKTLKSVEDDLLPGYLEALKTYLEPYLNKNLGLSAGELAEALESFPGNAGSSILENVVEKPLAVVQEELRIAKAALQNDGWDADTIGFDLFERTRKEIVTLRNAFGANNYRFTMIVNDLAGTLLNCSIAFFNTYQNRFEIDPGQGALILLDRAKALGAGDEIRERIRVNEPVIKQWAAASGSRKRIKAVRENVKNIYRLLDDREDISDSSAAFKFIDDCDIDLYAIEEELGAADPEYLRFADMVINHAINASIEGVNTAQNNANEAAENLNRAGAIKDSFQLAQARIVFDIYKTELQSADKVISRSRVIPCSESMKERVENNGRVLRGLMSGMSVSGLTAPKRPSQRVKEEKERASRPKPEFKPLTVGGKVIPESGRHAQHQEGSTYWNSTTKGWALLMLLYLIFLVILTITSI